MEVILVSRNAPDAMLTSSLPVLNVTDVRLEQSLNVSVWMDVTDAGILMETSGVPRNA